MPTLQRVVSRWQIVALAINGVIGSGVFLLPAAAAAMLGPASLWAVVLAAEKAGLGPGEWEAQAARSRLEDLRRMAAVSSRDAWYRPSGSWGRSSAWPQIPRHVSTFA